MLLKGNACARGKQLCSVWDTESLKQHSQTATTPWLPSQTDWSPAQCTGEGCRTGGHSWLPKNRVAAAHPQTHATSLRPQGTALYLPLESAVPLQHLMANGRSDVQPSAVAEASEGYPDPWPTGVICRAGRFVAISHPRSVHMQSPAEEPPMLRRCPRRQSSAGGPPCSRDVAS